MSISLLYRGLTKINLYFNNQQQFSTTTDGLPGCSSIFCFMKRDKRKNNRAPYLVSDGHI